MAPFGTLTRDNDFDESLNAEGMSHDVEHSIESALSLGLAPSEATKRLRANEKDWGAKALVGAVKGGHKRDAREVMEVRSLIVLFCPLILSR